VRAVVYTADGTVALRDRPEPVPGPGEVLLRPLAVGICGTDLHPESFAFDPDVVMGHEFVAQVVGLGPDVADVRAGDRMVVNPNGITCGTCAACRCGRANLCASARRVSIGIHRDGGLADFVVLPTRALHRVPDSLSDEDAAWVEPLAANIRSVAAAGSVLGTFALVIGGGPMGLLTLQLLRNAGASFVGVVEPVAFRRSVADRLLADETYDSAESAERMPEAPSVVFECSGSPRALSDALHLVTPGGSVVAVGIGPASPGVRSMDLVGKEITVHGSSLYVGEFPVAIDLLSRGRIDVRALTSGVEPLDRFESAFRLMRQPEATVKLLLRP
jgi:(R,R)-butanediol dehydrogenase/meso-butanediol dehydrogenase/diacetyl reductase